MTTPNLVEAISRAYGVEPATVEAAIASGIAGHVAPLLCIGVNLSAQELPEGPDMRREYIEMAIATHKLKTERGQTALDIALGCHHEAVTRVLRIEQRHQIRESAPDR